VHPGLYPGFWGFPERGFLGIFPSDCGGPNELKTVAIAREAISSTFSIMGGLNLLDYEEYVENTHNNEN
jgi:hypothetical protein